MKKISLKSIVAGLALTVAASSSVLASTPVPVPLVVNFNAAITYNNNTNLNNLGGTFGGTNGWSKFAIAAPADLVNYLNNSATFTNDLWHYTWLRSYGLSFNATQGRNPVGVGITQLPAGVYLVLAPYSKPNGVLFGGLGLTNSSGFWFPLESGTQWTLVNPINVFRIGSTPISWSAPRTYASLVFSQAIGQGSVVNTGAAESDYLSWEFYFNNLAENNWQVDFDVEGQAQLTLTASAAITLKTSPFKGGRAYTIRATGTGKPEYFFNEFLGGLAVGPKTVKPKIFGAEPAYFGPLALPVNYLPVLDTTYFYLQANISLAGAGNGTSSALDPDEDNDDSFLPFWSYVNDWYDDDF